MKEGVAVGVGVGGTSTSQEQKQEQHLPIRHAGRPADFGINIKIFKDMVRKRERETNKKYFTESIITPLAYVYNGLIYGL